MHLLLRFKAGAQERIPRFRIHKADAKMLQVWQEGQSLHGLNNHCVKDAVKCHEFFAHSIHS
jgi:hypothetical protein